MVRTESTTLEARCGKGAGSRKKGSGNKKGASRGQGKRKSRSQELRAMRKIAGSRVLVSGHLVPPDSDQVYPDVRVAGPENVLFGKVVRRYHLQHWSY